MEQSQFMYVTYIRTTPERLWDALLKPEFTRQYWCEVVPESTWEPGADWKLIAPDGRVADSGSIVEIDAPKKLFVRWRNEFRPELKEEGYSTCVFELEPQGDMVKLTVVQTIDRAESKLIEAFGGGWPVILCSLKSLLETGEALEATRTWPKGM